MNRKVYCSCDSDFTNHFKNQAGRGFDDITLYRGQPYQRGYGFGSLFKRFGVPILKLFGRELLKTGVNVGQDLLENQNLKETLKKRGKEGIRSVAKLGLNEIRKTFDQTGSGIIRRKRKRTQKKKNKVSAKKQRKVYKKSKKRKKSKDIFD